jgi:predicted DNA-binding transcriptional regulator AlpA
MKQSAAVATVQTVDPDEVLSLKQFLRIYHMSESKFYRLKREGRAPVFVQDGDGGRITISRAAARTWQAAREAAAAKQQTTVK